MDFTHDAGRRSWLETGEGDFPLQNLPFGRFAANDGPRLGVAIGERLVDLVRAVEAGLIQCESRCLNELAPQAGAVRRRLSELLGTDDQAVREKVEKVLLPLSDARMLMPFDVGDYTDFYASVYHATNVGSMFRPDNPLLPNYKHLPVGYHGRASTLVPSGTPVRRPCGQLMADGAQAPERGPSKLLDYELEVGFFVGRSSSMGEVVPIESAWDHLFGVCLVNDWSARDIQKWEYQPLGPFLAKSFATSVSPWVVHRTALEPFFCAPFERPADDPRPLPYLSWDGDRGLDLTVEVFLSSEKMRSEKVEPVRISSGSLRHMYWTPAQMLAHHASNGCAMLAGDLLASGTVSGPERSSRGCLLELTWDGAGQPRKAIELPGGETRVFLQDGDEVILRGYCEREGFRRIGLGECRGVVLPALVEALK